MDNLSNLLKRMKIAEQQGRIGKNKKHQIVILVRKTRRSSLWGLLLGVENEFAVGKKKILLKNRILMQSKNLAESDDDITDVKDDEAGESEED